MRENGEAFQLIDVREPYEAERCTLGGTLVHLGDVLDRLAEIQGVMCPWWYTARAAAAPVR